MPVVSLDAVFVRSAACPAGKAKETYYDVAITGFILELRASGSGTYWLRYRDTHGKQRQHKIGDAKSLTFEQARNAAQTLRAQVVLGDDPAAARQIRRQVPRFETFMLERYVPFVKGYKRSWAQDLSLIRNHLLDRFAGRHLDEIGKQEVVAMHHGLRAAGYKPASCNRILVLLRYAYNLALEWEITGVTRNPTAGIPMFEADKRERYLTVEESRRLVDALETSDNPQLKFIVPLLLLTGCRKREILDARWADIDQARRVWTIPVTKAGKPRHIPISTTVLQLLAQMPRWDGCPFVVPNPKSKQPYVSIFCSWDTARRQAGMPELRMHDLRHSFASFLVNSGRSLYEVAKCLGHSQIKTTQRYAHLAPSTLLEAADVAAAATGLHFGPVTA